MAALLTSARVRPAVLQVQRSEAVTDRTGSAGRVEPALRQRGAAALLRVREHWWCRPHDPTQLYSPLCIVHHNLCRKHRNTTLQILAVVISVITLLMTVSNALQLCSKLTSCPCVWLGGRAADAPQ